MLSKTQTADSSDVLIFAYLKKNNVFIVAGIDLAFIENGFIYHTKYDTADRILTDSIQRAGT